MAWRSRSTEERAMPTYLIRDTRMIRNTLDTTMRNNPLTVPIVIGELWERGVINSLVAQWLEHLHT